MRETLAAGVTLALLTLTACGRAEDQTTPTPPTSGTTITLPRGLPTMPEPDRRDPVAVAEAALIRMASQDTLTDTSPQAAVERAMPLMDPAYARTLREHPVEVRQDWNALSAHRGYTTVKVFPTEEERLASQAGPIPSPSGLIKVIRAVTIESHGEKNWTAIETTTTTLQLHQGPDGRWAVTGYYR